MSSQRVTLFAVIVGAVLAAPGVVSGGTITGKATVPGMRDSANVLVYIASAPGSFSPQATPEMDQVGLVFHPHILPIVAGTTVKFLNSDRVWHNVFTASTPGRPFNTSMPPKGQGWPYTFAREGKVELRCGVHHQMRAYILVLQNPFFAVTDREGNFRIENVPPGSYTVKVWHERATGPAKTVQVSNGTLTVNFELAAQ